MDFAVVKFGGKQYLAKDGQSILAQGKLAEEKGPFTDFEVLLIKNGDNVEVGTPLISNHGLTASVEEISKGDKIRVAKFKAKSRYRRVTGFRPVVTKVTFFAQDASEKKTAKKTK